jgi:hypothetical protein
MAQKQGNQTSEGGRLDGSLGTAIAAGNVAIGAGWGGTATAAIRSGSTDQRGIITITASASTPAQATATIALTFADGAYASTPAYFSWQLLSSSNAVAEPNSFSAQACTTTALTCTYGTLPVAAATYTFAYLVIA